jgi:hypothetical protein
MHTQIGLDGDSGVRLRRTVRPAGADYTGNMHSSVAVGISVLSAGFKTLQGWRKNLMGLTAVSCC